MRTIVFGENKSGIEQLVGNAGFQLVETDPEFVISYGGDGTLMKAEYAYPGIPKIILKNSQVCKKCSPLSNEEVLRRVQGGRYRVEELMKLKVAAAGKTLRAINDIILHNQDARHAIRYSININNQAVGHVIIGDGIVVATPFGSTAYYRSITDSFFEVGIGLAFNNSTEQSDHMILKEDGIILIKIIRGPAVIYADNQQNEINLQEADDVIIKKSIENAKIIVPQ